MLAEGDVASWRRGLIESRAPTHKTTTLYGDAPGVAQPIHIHCDNKRDGKKERKWEIISLLDEKRQRAVLG